MYQIGKYKHNNNEFKARHAVCLSSHGQAAMESLGPVSGHIKM